MTEKLFMVSVADYYMYDNDQNLLAAGKTLSESTMELTVNSTDVRGGKGAPLQYIYFNSPDMNITLTDTQFNLPFISLSTGEAIANGANPSGNSWMPWTKTCPNPSGPSTSPS